MSRFLRLLLTILGGVVVFAVFAVAGFAVSGWMSEDEPEATEPVLEFPAAPAADDLEAQIEFLAGEQSQTGLAMAGDAPPDEPFGAAVAGMQTVRDVPVGEVDAAVEAALGDLPVDPGSDDPPEDAVPAEVFTDAPYLRGRIDLTEVIVADPRPPLNLDICAGPERLPETPSGCPPGFGGTIVTFDGPAPILPAVGGRPPTGLTAHGIDWLFVRTFRRSSVAERVKVEAVEWADPDAGTPPACDPDDEVGISPPLPRTTIEVDTSGADWPYDPDFDTLEVFGLGLSEGTQYVVCTYWIDSTGVASVVSYWEQRMVTTAAARRMTVTVPGFETVNNGPHGDPVAEPQLIHLNTGCGREIYEWPGVGRFVTDQADDVLCQLDGVSSVVQNGGIPVTIVLEYEDSSANPVVYASHWLSIDRADVLCRTACVESVVQGFPMPEVEHDLIVPGGRGAIPPSFYLAGSLVLLVEFDEPSGAHHGWHLGDEEGFDTSDAIVERPPLLTRVSKIHPLGRPEPVGDGGMGLTTLFTIENAVPVSIDVELLDAGNPTPDGQPCMPGGAPVPAFTSSAPATRHVFVFEGLCFGEIYQLQISAIDEAGVAYDVRDRARYGDGADKYRFDTLNRVGPTLYLPGYTFWLEAGVVLPGGPACHYLGDLTLTAAESFGAAIAPTQVQRLNIRTQREWDDARWNQGSINPRLFDTFGEAPSPVITMDLTPGNPMLGIEAAEYFTVSLPIRFGDRSSECIERNISRLTESVELAAHVTLTDLLGGVVLTAPGDSSPSLTLRAVFLRRTTPS